MPFGTPLQPNGQLGHPGLQLMTYLLHYPFFFVNCLCRGGLILRISPSSDQFRAEDIVNKMSFPGHLDLAVIATGQI